MTSDSEGPSIDLAAVDAERDRIRAEYLEPEDSRPLSMARGLHHFAIVARDVEETVRFYQGVLGFPLTDIFENRDYKGSNHFFFDIGNDNLIAFFDFPGLDVAAQEREVVHAPCRRRRPVGGEVPRPQLVPLGAAVHTALSSC